MNFVLCIAVYVHSSLHFNLGFFPFMYCYCFFLHKVSYFSITTIRNPKSILERYYVSMQLDCNLTINIIGNNQCFLIFSVYMRPFDNFFLFINCPETFSLHPFSWHLTRSLMFASQGNIFTAH